MPNKVICSMPGIRLTVTTVPSNTCLNHCLLNLAPPSTEQSYRKGQEVCAQLPKPCGFAKSLGCTQTHSLLFWQSDSPTRQARPINHSTIVYRKLPSLLLWKGLSGCISPIAFFSYKCFYRVCLPSKWHLLRNNSVLRYFIHQSLKELPINTLGRQKITSPDYDITQRWVILAKSRIVMFQLTHGIWILDGLQKEGLK